MCVCVGASVRGRVFDVCVCVGGGGEVVRGVCVGEGVCAIQCHVWSAYTCPTSPFPCVIKPAIIVNRIVA